MYAGASPKQVVNQFYSKNGGKCPFYKSSESTQGYECRILTQQVQVPPETIVPAYEYFGYGPSKRIAEQVASMAVAEQLGQLGVLDKDVAAIKQTLDYIIQGHAAQLAENSSGKGVAKLIECSREEALTICNMIIDELRKESSLSWLTIVERRNVVARLKPWVNHCLFKILKENNLVTVDQASQHNNLNEMRWRLVYAHQPPITDADIPAHYLPREELYKRMPGIQSEWKSEVGGLRKDHFRKRVLPYLEAALPAAVFSETLMKDLSIPRVLTNEVEDELGVLVGEGHVHKYEQTADTGYAVFAWGFMNQDLKIKLEEVKTQVPDVAMSTEVTTVDGATGEAGAKIVAIGGEVKAEERPTVHQLPNQEVLTWSKSGIPPKPRPPSQQKRRRTDSDATKPTAKRGPLNSGIKKKPSSWQTPNGAGRGRGRGGFQRGGGPGRGASGRGAPGRGGGLGGRGVSQPSSGSTAGTITAEDLEVHQVLMREGTVMSVQQLCSKLSSNTQHGQVEGILASRLQPMGLVSRAGRGLWRANPVGSAPPARPRERGGYTGRGRGGRYQGSTMPRTDPNYSHAPFKPVWQNAPAQQVPNMTYGPPASFPQYAPQAPAFVQPPAHVHIQPPPGAVQPVQSMQPVYAQPQVQVMAQGPPPGQIVGGFVAPYAQGPPQQHMVGRPQQGGQPVYIGPAGY